MKKELRDYQNRNNDDLVRMYVEGKKRVIMQLPTGGGKSLQTAEFIKRYLQGNPNKKAIFFVHRDRLLKQFKDTMKAQTGIDCAEIVSSTKYRDVRYKVYVSMVQTGFNRIKKNPNWFGQDIGLVVYDEAHLGVHRKMIDAFPDAFTVGLTATPLSASKKHPMKELYEDIISNIGIKELIEKGSLCQNITFHSKDNVNFSSLRLTNGEFNNSQMGNEYSKGKNIYNVVKKYEEKALGKKTIVFNCNIAHSKKVNEAFLEKGYDSRHLDGTMSQEEKDDILQWFEETPGAILNNIDILTAGADFPSIECVIMNRATMSLTLWLQACGRGSRPSEGKDSFIIIDLGGNAMRHGNWNDDRDWKDMFFNPPKPAKKEGVAKIKICINSECEAMIPAGATVCPYCQAKQPIKEVKYDAKEIELVEFDVVKGLEFAHKKGYNPYSVLHQVKVAIVKDAFNSHAEMNETRYYNLLGIFQMRVQKWCKEEGKRYDMWHKTTTAEWFRKEVYKQFNFSLQTQSI